MLWVCEIVLAEHDSLAPYRDRIMLSMGAVTVLLLFPFTVNNLLQGRPLMAAILALIQIVTLLNTWALRQGRPAPIPYTLLLLPFIVGITAGTVVQGVPGILWSYPLIVYCHFVLSRRTAIVCSLVFLVYVTLLAAYAIAPPLALRLFGTLLVSIIMINIVLNVISDLHRTLANQALTDPLTGVFNRRFMQEMLDGLVTRSARRPMTASVLMFDIDHFKRVNDELGHARGDEALCEVVRRVSARMRAQDRLFRWGGEEFLLLLEDAGVDGARQVAEEMRTAVEQAEILADRQVTISIGVAQYRAGQSADAWVQAADEALYRAKAAGRNCVVCAPA
jgi:diguanylate cyclase (GGDEF)-like protein